MNSKEKSVSDIKARKADLEKEIKRLENKFAKKTERVKKRVDSTMKPIQRIKKRPFVAVSFAVLTGFVLGSGTGGRRRKNSTANKSDSLTSLITVELKKLAARRAIELISDYVDTELIPRLKKSRSGKGSDEDFLDS